MAWELTYRNSFIDVEEKCLERPRRARSLSPQASLIECPEEEQLRSYVLGLAQKVEDVEVSEANEDEGGLLVPEKPASTSPPSVGSAGHPEVCRRPCLHFTRGYCEEGSACNFCHIVHEKTAKLDKKQRSIIYDLNLKQRSGLVFPFVEQKIAELGGMAEHGQELLGFLHEGADADLSFIPSKELRHLRKTFGRMSLYSLIGILTKAAGDEEAQDSEEPSGRIYALMDKFREELS